MFGFRSVRPHHGIQGQCGDYLHARGVAPSSTRPGRCSTGPRPFVVDRNMRHFLWYGGVASEGLRSVGPDGELPIQERVLYPAHRSPSPGRDTPAKLGYPGPWLRGERWWMLSWALTSWAFLRLLLM